VTRITSPELSEEALYDFLMSPIAVRECAEAIYAAALADKSAHWIVDEGRLLAVVNRVGRVTRASYPDVKKVPFHGRLRHFGAGGVPRVARFERRIDAASDHDRDQEDERLRARFELVITSVLLDAGAGPKWKYTETDGGIYARSEGLAVASYDWFMAGGFASDGVTPRADATGLSSVEPGAVEAAFQVDTTNPLVGSDGRAALLRKLGEVVGATPRWFGTQGRLGEFGVVLKGMAENGSLPAVTLFDAVQKALGPIWPGRSTLAGKNLGDVWTHSTFGWVPFHKLIQWLTYSLCEPLASSGVRVTGTDDLTGLAEYRNGGLFVDEGVLVLKDEKAHGGTHAVSSDLVIEWRALTVALLDRTVAGLRPLLGVTAEELPLVSALEGGTWSAGREIAKEKRAHGGPPIVVESDGTVF
jgi:hypothetical protein